LELDAVKMLDGDAKAMRLKPYLNLDLLPAREFALKELSQCGPSALATIRGMLDDAAFVNQRPEIIQAYVAAGGEAIAEDLNARLREQLTFWRATASSLSQGWWNDTPANDAIRNRYSDTLELLRVLQRMHYSEALYAATQLRDFWRSLPQLNDPSGLDQMIEECDKLIAHLQTN